MDQEEVLEVVKVSEEVESICETEIDVTSPKKRKRKPQEDNVERPKRPRSAYLLYYFDVHQIMQLGTQNLPQSEVNKKISESWKKLSVAEKSYYLERAKLEKDGIDTSSLSSSKHMPGFRKILPRANCFLLPKGSFLSHQPGGSRSEVNIRPLDLCAEGGLQSVCLTQESQITPVGLGADAEPLERHVVADDVEGETEAPPSVDLRGISAPSSSKSTISTNTHVSQGAADFMVNGVSLNSNETRVPSSSYNGAMVQQTRGETTQVVTILPTQNLLEAQSVAGIGSLHPVMMISLGAKPEQTAKPSYKISLKTYTRRGHGRCLNPGCSFSYVTRHKPPTCPECGSHLGGKWIPVEKWTAASKLTAETEPDESCEVTPQPAEKGKADVSKTNTDESKNERRDQHSSKSQHAGPVEMPLGDSSTTPHPQTKYFYAGCNIL